MTPKLYEEVQTALSERWGVWGGWTQAVSFPRLVSTRPLVRFHRSSTGFTSFSNGSLTLAFSFAFLVALCSYLAGFRSSSPPTSPSFFPPSPQTLRNHSSNLSSDLPNFLNPILVYLKVSSPYRRACSPRLLPQKPNPPSRSKEEGGWRLRVRSRSAVAIRGR